MTSASARATEEDALASLAEGSALDLDAALLAATEGDAPRADRALDAAYPLASGGAVLFPFRRIFFTLRV